MFKVNVNGKTKSEQVDPFMGQVIEVDYSGGEIGNGILVGVENVSTSSSDTPTPRSDSTTSSHDSNETTPVNAKNSSVESYVNSQIALPASSYFAFFSGSSVTHTSQITRPSLSNSSSSLTVTTISTSTSAASSPLSSTALEISTSPRSSQSDSSQNDSSTSKPRPHPSPRQGFIESFEKAKRENADFYRGECKNFWREGSPKIDRAQELISDINKVCSKHNCFPTVANLQYLYGEDRELVFDMLKNLARLCCFVGDDDSADTNLKTAYRALFPGGHDSDPEGFQKFKAEVLDGAYPLSTLSRFT